MNNSTTIFTRTVLSRILAGFLMVALIAWAYWWLVLAVAIVFLLMYRTYYEILVWGIAYDALYASPALRYHIVTGHFAVWLAVILFLCGVFFKKRLSVYS